MTLLLENFIEIKKFHLNEINSKKLDELISAKEKWSEILTIANRRSTIKMIFENDQILDALRITINSRVQIEVKEKALEYFRIEAKRPYDEKKDRIEVFDDNESIVNDFSTLNINNMDIPLNQIFYIALENFD